jgi:5-formyltetrahydrofolate cyclo-ligase
MGCVDELAARKRRLRASLRRSRPEVPAARALAAAEAVAARVVALPEFGAARRVALYAALSEELPTAPLFERARGAGKRLLWPRLVEGRLEFAACPRPEDLCPGALGIPAPPASLPAEIPGTGDLVVVPGLAFDAAGRRLGRGGGHYDRAFPPGRPGAPLLVGVGYAFQLLEEVPAGAQDRRMDAVITEARLVRVLLPSPAA